jgi:hypothetical protein
MIETLASSDAAVKHLGKAVYTVDEVKTIDTQDQDLKSKATMLQMLGYGLPVAELKVAVQTKKEAQEALINGDNLKTDYRKVVGII